MKDLIDELLDDPEDSPASPPRWDHAPLFAALETALNQGSGHHVVYDLAPGDDRKAFYAADEALDGAFEAAVGWLCERLGPAQGVRFGDDKDAPDTASARIATWQRGDEHIVLTLESEPSLGVALLLLQLEA